jgi:RNA polymerase sigma-70 factor (ECF subfamily)
MNLKFNTLVNLYQDQVYNLASYLVRDRFEAEDITQEVYIRLWENMQDVEFVRAKLWLMKVTRNLCLDV